MRRPFTPKVITAKRFLEGDTVWLRIDNQWSINMSEAELIEDEAHAELRLLEAHKMEDLVVNPNLIEAKA